VGLWLAAAGAQAMPGAVSPAEVALVRAAIGSETIVGETHKRSELPCASEVGADSECKLDAEFARGIALANARHGHLFCRALELPAERCVRRRELKLRMFHRFPAVMFSRPAFSTDGKSAVVYRTRYSSPDHGQHAWVFLTRDAAGLPWKVVLEQRVAKF
jgi:hypothetical protein